MQFAHHLSTVCATQMLMSFLMSRQCRRRVCLWAGLIKRESERTFRRSALAARVTFQHSRTPAWLTSRCGRCQTQIWLAADGNRFERAKVGAGPKRRASSGKRGFIFRAAERRRRFQPTTEVRLALGHQPEARALKVSRGASFETRHGAAAPNKANSLLRGPLPPCLWSVQTGPTQGVTAPPQHVSTAYAAVLQQEEA